MESSREIQLLLQRAKTSGEWTVPSKVVREELEFLIHLLPEQAETIKERLVKIVQHEKFMWEQV